MDTSKKSYVINLVTCISTVVIGVISIVIAIGAWKLNKDYDYRQKMLEPMNAIVSADKKKTNLEIEYSDGSSKSVKVPQIVINAKTGFPVRTFDFLPDKGDVKYMGNIDFSKDVTNKKIQKLNYENNIDFPEELNPLPIVAESKVDGKEWAYYYLVVEGLNGKKQIFTVVYQFNNGKYNWCHVYAERDLLSENDNVRKGINSDLLSTLRKESQKVQEFMQKNQL